MNDFFTRPILMSDISFFMSECEEGARNGHLYSEIITQKGNEFFEKQIRNLIKENELEN